MNSLLKVAVFIRQHAKEYKLTPTEKLFLFTLAGRIGNNKVSWVSQSTLAEELEISSRQLIRLISKLLKLDLILINKNWRNNQYRLSEKIFPKNDKATSVSHDKRKNEVTSMSQTTGHEVTPMSHDDNLKVSWMSHEKSHGCHMRTEEKIPQDRSTPGLQLIEFPTKGNKSKIKDKKDITIVISKKEKVKRGCQISDLFHVTEKHLDLAEENGWPSPYDEIDGFRDYHLARGTVFKDWDRAFYTWLRNAKKFKQQGASYEKSQYVHRPSKAEIFAKAVAGAFTGSDDFVTHVNREDFW